MRKRIEANPGVLAKEQLQELIRSKSISASSEPDYDASAFDLRIGEKAWVLNEGLRPTTRQLDKIRRAAKDLVPEEGQFVLKRGEIYLLELDHYLDLPANVSGRATGRSSIGRLDVITRLLVPGCQEFDVVPAGHEGPLYLLVVPQTFSIKIAPGGSLNQLRLFCGSQSGAVLSKDALVHYGVPFWWVKDGNEYRSWPDEREPEDGRSRITEDPLLLNLTVDLEDPSERFVFEAKNDVDDIIDLGKKNAHEPAKFFQKLPVDSEDGSVTLVQDRFYIMKSRERLHIPLGVAVEVVAISERIGDIRIHYAGFAHPGFGTKRIDDRRGTPLIFEVRSTDMKTRLSQGALLARVQLFRMSREPIVDELEKTSYANQELQLSNYFAPW